MGVGVSVGDEYISYTRTPPNPQDSFTNTFTATPSHPIKMKICKRNTEIMKTNMTVLDVHHSSKTSMTLKLSFFVHFSLCFEKFSLLDDANNDRNTNEKYLKVIILRHLLYYRNVPENSIDYENQNVIHAFDLYFKKKDKI